MAPLGRSKGSWRFCGVAGLTVKLKVVVWRKMIRYFRIRDKKLQLNEQTGANTDAVTVVRLSSVARELASFHGKSA